MRASFARALAALLLSAAACTERPNAEQRETLEQAGTKHVSQGPTTRERVTSEPEPLPLLIAERAEAIALDGVLDEVAWRAARPTEPFVNTLHGGEVAPRTTVKALWDDERLYVAFEVADPWLKSHFTRRDDHLWEEDCVEIMVDPDGDGKSYFELQVSPRNQVFDTRYDRRRVPRPFGHVEWNAAIQSAVAVHEGGVVDDDQEDHGYTVELAIAWESFASGAPAAQPPQAGETWRINFYVMDALESSLRAAGWSPPKVRDFHVPARFGRLQFAGAPHAP